MEWSYMRYPWCLVRKQDEVGWSREYTHILEDDSVPNILIDESAHLGRVALACEEDEPSLSRGELRPCLGRRARQAPPSTPVATRASSAAGPMATRELANSVAGPTVTPPGELCPWPWRPRRSGWAPPWAHDGASDLRPQPRRPCGWPPPWAPGAPASSATGRRHTGELALASTAAPVSSSPDGRAREVRRAGAAELRRELVMTRATSTPDRKVCAGDRRRAWVHWRAPPRAAGTQAS